MCTRSCPVRDRVLSGHRGFFYGRQEAGLGGRDSGEWDVDRGSKTGGSPWRNDERVSKTGVQVVDLVVRVSVGTDGGEIQGHVFGKTPSGGKGR